MNKHKKHESFKISDLKLYFDRSFSGGIKLQIKWLAFIMLAVYFILVLLSLFDFFYSSETSDNGRWLDVFFLMLNPGEGGVAVGSYFAVIISVVGMIVFSGMLISVMSNVLERRVENYKAGEANYTVSNHYVILGFNKGIPSLLKKIHQKNGKGYIILMCNRNSEYIRDWVHANVSSDIEKRLIIMNGERDASDDLERLSLNSQLKEIYVLGEENEEGHDDRSLVCIKNLSKIINDKERKIPCYVQIDSATIFSLLQQSDFIRNEGITNLAFHPFNFNEIWAQKVLSLTSFDGDNYLPLDGKGIGPDSKKHVHLIIVGMSDMGKALALNAAQVLHFPNFKEGDYDTYTRISFIDPNAEEIGERFRNKYSALFDLARWKADDKWIDPLADADSKSPYRYLGPLNFMDIEWEFINADVAQPEIRQYIADSCEAYNSLTTIALCDDNSDRNLAICQALPIKVFEGQALNMILVRQQISGIPVRMLRNIPLRDEKIRAFGMMTECYSENLLSDEFGKLINALYEANDKHENIDLENDGEKIESWWKNAKITDRWSSNYSANMLFIKLRFLGFNSDNISSELISEKLSDPIIQEWFQRTEHNRWNTEKLLLGFVPLTREEQAPLIAVGSGTESFGNIRGKLKKDKKHIDICSNETLKKIDPSVAEYDNVVNKKLWDLYNLFTRKAAGITF